MGKEEKIMISNVSS